MRGSLQPSQRRYLRTTSVKASRSGPARSSVRRAGAPAGRKNRTVSATSSSCTTCKSPVLGHDGEDRQGSKAAEECAATIGGPADDDGRT